MVASLLYFLPLGVAGLIVARLILGAGEGVVYTASSAWVVDITDPGRRGRIIGLYGLAIWGGLSFGPPIGDFLLRAVGYEAVWAFAAAAPLLAAIVAERIPEPPRPDPDPGATHRTRLFAPEALGPGLAMTMATLGYAALAGFIVLHLDDRGIDHGATHLHGLRADGRRRADPVRVAPRPLRRRPLRDRRRVARGARPDPDRARRAASRRR